MQLQLMNLLILILRLHTPGNFFYGSLLYDAVVKVFRLWFVSCLTALSSLVGV